MTQKFIPYSVHFVIDDESTSYALLHALDSQSQLLAEERSVEPAEADALLEANGRLLEVLRQAWLHSNGQSCPEETRAV